MLPVLPAVALMIVLLSAEPIEACLRWVCSDRLRLSVFALAAIALALPEVNILHAPAVAGSIFTPDRTCPTGASVLDPGHYYHCLAHDAWGRHWLLLSSYRALGRAWGFAFAVAFAALWSALVALIASSLGRRAGSAPSRGHLEPASASS